MLHEKHRQEWLNSKVSEDILTRNVWSIEDPREVDQLLNRNTDKRWKHSNDLAPGWAVAGVDPKSGERSMKGAQYKPDVAPIDTETKKPRKYFSPSRQALAPLFLGMEDAEYWRKLLTNFTSPIVVTEGAKKAGAVLSLEIPCISLPGVSTGGKLGRLRPELEMFCNYGRAIYLAFDRDIVQKPQVRKALHKLAAMIAEKGARVYVVEWPNQFKGLDDYIAAGGDFSSRMQQALTIEEWREQCEEEAVEPLEGEKCRLARRIELVEGILKGRLKWNALKSKIELDGESVEVEDLRIKLAVQHNIDIPFEDCCQIATYLAKKQTFSPVAEYLKQCAEVYGPDEELLESLAETYFGATEPLHKAYLRKTLIAAVARAMLPGCKVDAVCILAGPQEAGKSSFWRILASEEWFDDSFGSASDKDERLKLHQSWILEWAELEAVFKRKDISAIKAFITTQVDQVRPPYGRSVLNFSRPSIFVGTTNETEFLADPTGNRRYWIIPIQIPTIPLEKLAEERDRIWAAATHAFQKGERWELPTELKQVAKLDNLNYTFSDPWEQAIQEYCEGRERVTALEIMANALHIDIENMDKRSEMRVTTILKTTGWQKTRESLKGKKLRFWTAPTPETEDGTNLDEGGVGPVENENSEKNLLLPKEVGRGWSDDTQTLMGVSGPTSDQPPGQPPGQPPEKLKRDTAKSQEKVTSENGTNLGLPFPKSGNIQVKTLCTPDKPLKKPDEPFKKGDWVEIYLETGWEIAIYDHPLKQGVFSALQSAIRDGHQVKFGGQIRKVAAPDLRHYQGGEGDALE